MLRRKELVLLLLSIFILSLSLGFDDGREIFIWSAWLGNFIVVTLLVTIAFVAQQLGHKIVARMNGFDTEYSYWGIQSFTLSTRRLMGKIKNKPFPRTYTFFGKKILVESFPLGLLLCFLFTILSNGQLFFLAVGQYTLLLKKSSRFGRKFLEVTHYEEAKIALAGPMVNISLLIIAKLFNSSGNFDAFIFINATLALFHMLPLPHLAGLKVYFGSRLLYVSSLVFMIAMVILAYTVSTIPMLLISLVSLFVAGSLYYYYTYFKS